MKALLERRTRMPLLMVSRHASEVTMACKLMGTFTDIACAVLINIVTGKYCSAQ